MDWILVAKKQIYLNQIVSHIIISLKLYITHYINPSMNHQPTTTAFSPNKNAQTTKM
jgi:hypothetical protein